MSITNIDYLPGNSIIINPYLHMKIYVHACPVNIKKLLSVVVNVVLPLLRNYIIH